MRGKDEEARRGEPSIAFEDVRPEDQPFPPSDAECARLMRGHPVRRRGTPERALRLPGTYELVGGWPYLRRSRGRHSRPPSRRRKVS